MWWLLGFLVAFLVFMFASFTSMYFFGRAMSLANPNQPLPFRTSIGSPFLKLMYASTDPEVIRYRTKYERHFIVSIVAMVTVAICFMNAPHLKI
jgi:hypothetical protein